jgi:branched-chain amino acid transport system ATP-binding protein
VSAAPLLELRGVTAGYGAIEALSDVSLEVGEGEVVTLIGANGSGKTTALMAVCGVVPARSGEVRFAGRPIQGLAAAEIVRLGVVQVPEGRRIFPRLTVAENLEMGAFLRRDPAAVRRDREEVYALFPVLAGRRRQPGGTLSGGEQQMLALGRALMAAPRLLLLDEPSLGLAPIVVRQIFAVVGRMNRERGTTVLLVEQNAHLALQTADRGYVLETGRVVLQGSGSALLADPGVRSAYLGM